MKLLVGTGAELAVYDLGPRLMVLRRRPNGPPINGCRLLEDDAAREVVRTQLDLGLYDRVEG
jgi:hypothetical protein